MVNKIFKGLIRFLIEVIVMTVLIVGINIFTNGMYLWGLPRINDIQSVNITYPSVTDDVKEISSSEDIELALKLTGFLKYDLFGEVNSEEEPAITILHFLLRNRSGNETPGRDRAVEHTVTDAFDLAGFTHGCVANLVIRNTVTA